jgi:hypothetical protein
MTHAVDPKMQLGSKFDGIGRIEQVNKNPDINAYYNFYPEFDAYCRQIIEYIRFQVSLRPNDKLSLTKWLESSKPTYLPFILQPYSRLISSWYQNDSKYKIDYVKKLKIRLFNELIKSDINA